MCLALSLLIFWSQTPLAQEPSRPSQPSPSAPPGLFVDLSASLYRLYRPGLDAPTGGHPLLPQKLPPLGPAVGWFDLDGDGWDDLIIGTGRHNSIAFLRNAREDRFTHLKSPEGSGDREETGALLGFVDPRLSRNILISLANLPAGISNRSSVSVFQVKLIETNLNLKLVQELSPAPGSVGILALADIDNDGQLDLLAAGRSAGSATRIYRGSRDGFQSDTQNTARLAHL